MGHISVLEWSRDGKFDVLGTSMGLSSCWSFGPRDISRAAGGDGGHQAHVVEWLSNWIRTHGDPRGRRLFAAIDARDEHAVDCEECATLRSAAFQ